MTSSDMHGIEFSSGSDRDPKDESPNLGQPRPSPGIISTTIAFRPPSPSGTRQDLASVDVYGTQSYPTRPEEWQSWPHPHPEQDIVSGIAPMAGVHAGLAQVHEQEQEDKASVHSRAVSRRSVKRQDSDFLERPANLSYNGPGEAP